MLLQRLDMNLAKMPSTAGDEFESKNYDFENEAFDLSKQNINTDIPISPLLSGPFSMNNNRHHNVTTMASTSNHVNVNVNAASNSNASDSRSIPALPNLNAPSSTSWSSSSGIYSLFSNSIDKNGTSNNTNVNVNVANSNPFSSFLPLSKPKHPSSHVNVNANINVNNNINSNNHHLHHNVNVNHNHNLNHNHSLIQSKNSYHGNLHPSMQNMEMHAQMQASMHRNADPLEQFLGPFPCVRISRLPFETSPEDILLIFQGLVVLDLVILPHSYSQHGPGGEAFVVFGNPMDFQLALQRHRLHIGHQYVEVYQGKRADYYAAVSSMMQQYNPHRGDEAGKGEGNLESHQGNVWSASGVHHTTPSQVLRTPLMQDVAKNTGKTPGGPGGHTHTHALAHTQHHTHHSTYPKQPLSSSGSRPGRGSGESIRPKGAGRGSSRGGGIQVGDHTGFLRMRGLPFTATKGEIYEFFDIYEPILDSICLTYRSDGRATGEGYIAFAKPDNAKEAMALHRNTMGSRYIELFISNKEEHGRALAREASLLR